MSDNDLTLETAVAILRAVRAGQAPVTAARAFGVSRRALQQWRRRGRQEGRGPFFEFDLALREAAAAAINEAIDRVHEAAAAGNVKAATWLAEHLDPARWGSHAHELKELQRDLRELKSHLGIRERFSPR